MGLVYLVRHGVTGWNREHRYQGGRDVPLAEEGRRQARLLGERLAGRDWDAVWSSDLARARETAEIAAGGVVPVLDPGFREMAYGAWEGLTVTEVQRLYPAAFAAYRETGIVPGGEDPPALAARVGTAFRQLWRPEYRRVLLVAHGAVIKALILTLIGADLRLRARLAIDNASLSVVRVGPGPARLLRLNDTAHLERQASHTRPVGR